MNNDNDTKSPANDELTLVDIDQLRRTLGAEADVDDLPAAQAAGPKPTIMCVQWF